MLTRLYLEKNTNKNTLYVGGTAALSQFLVMAQSFLLARALGPEQYGLVAASLGITSLSVLIVRLGLDYWVLHKGSIESEKENLAGLVLFTRLLIACLWLPALVFIANRIAPGIYDLFVIGLLAISVLMEVFSSTGYMLFFIEGRFKESSIILIMGRILRLLSTVLLMATGVKTLYPYLLGRMIIDILVFLAVTVRSGIKLKFNYFCQKHGTLIQALPFGLSEILDGANSQLDINLISFATQDLITISFFSIILNLINGLVAVIQSIQNVILPNLSVKILDMDKKSRELTIRLTNLRFLILGILGLVFFLVFGPTIVNYIFGFKLTKLLPGLWMLSPVVILRSLVISLSMITIAMQRPKLRVKPQIVGILVKITLGFFLINSMGTGSFPFIFNISELIVTLSLAIVLKKLNQNHSNLTGDLQ